MDGSCLSHIVITSVTTIFAYGTGKYRTGLDKIIIFWPKYRTGKISKRMWIFHLIYKIIYLKLGKMFDIFTNLLDKNASFVYEETIWMWSIGRVLSGIQRYRTGENSEILKQYRTGQNLIRSGTVYRFWPFYPIRYGKQIWSRWSFSRKKISLQNYSQNNSFASKLLAFASQICNWQMCSYYKQSFIEKWKTLSCLQGENYQLSFKQSNWVLFTRPCFGRLNTPILFFLLFDCSHLPPLLLTFNKLERRDAISFLFVFICTLCHVWYFLCLLISAYIFFLLYYETETLKWLAAKIALYGKIVDLELFYS